DERGRDRERAAVAGNAVLRVERLEPELAQPALIFRRSAVRQRLEQEHRDPGPVIAVEDLFDRRTVCRLEDAEADRAAEVTTACVFAYSSVGLNSRISVPAVTTGMCPGGA